MDTLRPIRRALISVSDKTNIVDFCRALHQQGVELLSTGGTAKILIAHDIPVIQVSDHTGHPEIMDGRVKTLHPKIHGGILARRGIDEPSLLEQAIETIDLVVVNLYPFAQTIADPDCTLSDAIENIDIGGPTMIRAAAKNHHDVTIVVNNRDYQRVLEQMTQHQGATQLSLRFELAVAAFEHTASYEAMIANYFGSLLDKQHESLSTLSYNQSSDSQSSHSSVKFPPTLTTQFIKKQTLRYGENAHQDAAFYVENHIKEASIATAEQLQGKDLSFNNINDSDTALECVKNFDQPACVIVKHANPCGVATDVNLLQAYQRAFKTDPTSAFGGILAFNRQLDHQTAAHIIESQFVEVIIAPSVSKSAIEIIGKKKNIRLLICGQWQERTQQMDFKRVSGGILIQDNDQGHIQSSDLTIVSKRKPSHQEISDLLFSWRVAKYVKSNAIVYAKDSMTIGIGAGQMSRVYSAKVAQLKAKDEGLTVDGSVMASDAFFPFRDSIDAAAQAGITAVIQPGGSVRDSEVIAAANEHDIAMVFTGMRHFRH